MQGLLSNAARGSSTAERGHGVTLTVNRKFLAGNLGHMVLFLSSAIAYLLVLEEYFHLCYDSSTLSNSIMLLMSTCKLLSDPIITAKVLVVLLLIA